MRNALALVFIVFSTTLFAESAYKRSHSRHQYANGYDSGATQSGDARAARDVNINDEDDQTEVEETYQREHRYQTSGGGTGTTIGTYHNGGDARRTYYHHGDEATKEKIQEYETKRIGLLNQVDALYTRAEKCKTTLHQNPSMTRSERKSFEREIRLINFDIGEIGFQLGYNEFTSCHPDLRDLKRDAELFDLVWDISPRQYTAVFQESRLKSVEWQLTYLKELQASMATPFAERPARNRRDVNAELRKAIEELKRDLRETR